MTRPTVKNLKFQKIQDGGGYHLEKSKIAISRPRFGLKLKREVELIRYGGLLFHSAGTGFVRHYISSKFSRKNCKYKF